MTAPIGVRRNWATMSSTDRNAVIAALQRVKSSGRYDQLTEMHQMAMLNNSNEWHRRPILLPVHRWFLYQLEAAMGVPMPYWNFTTNRSLPVGVGGNGVESQGWRVIDGPFANWTSRIFNTTNGTFSSRAGIIRQTATFVASLPTNTHLNRALAETVYDASPWNQRSTTGFRNFVEGGAGRPRPGMHNRVHEWVGGDLRTGTSPNDPLFWLLHSNVDRIWARWQSMRGDANYAAPAGQRANDPMPLTGGVTPAQMFPRPPYDSIT